MARARGKQTLNVFVDTCIVNRILDLEESRPDREWEEDRKYLMELQSGPVVSGIIKLFVNPSVMRQVKATTVPERREALVNIAKQFKFTEFNMPSFPFSFPARFFSTAQKAKIRQLCLERPYLRKDRKILADSAFNKDMDVLMTTDRDLAKLQQLGTVKIMLPRELWQYYEAHKFENAF